MGKRVTAFAQAVTNHTTKADQAISQLEATVTAWKQQPEAEDLTDEFVAAYKQYRATMNQSKTTLTGIRSALKGDLKGFESYYSKKKAMKAMSGGFKTNNSAQTAEDAIGRAKACLDKLKDAINLC